MRIVLTGATSGLGRSAVDFLRTHRIDILACGRNPQALAELAALGIATQALDLAEADDTALARLCAGADSVWHCAALSAEHGNAGDFYRHNVIATEKLAQAASRNGVKRFVHISTPALYFDFRHHRNIRESYRARRFANEYARSKAQAEECLQRLAADSATIFTALRPRAIYGRYDRVLLPRLLALHRKTCGLLPLPRGGAVLLDMSFADNVAHAMWQANHAKLPHGTLHTYNISDGTPLPLRTLLAQLLPPLGLHYRILPLPYTPIAPLLHALPPCPHLPSAYSLGLLYYDMTLNLDKARRELAYHPACTTTDGIAATIAHHQAPPWPA